MSNKSRVTLYLDYDLHNQVKEFIQDSKDFKYMSELISYLLKSYINGDDLVTDNNLDKIKKDLASTDRNIRILLQIVSSHANKEQVLNKEYYENIYQYISATETMDDHFNLLKMNPYRKEVKEENTKPKKEITPKYSLDDF